MRYQKMLMLLVYFIIVFTASSSLAQLPAHDDAGIIYTNHLTMLRNEGGEIGDHGFDVMIDLFGLPTSWTSNMVKELKEPSYAQLVSDRHGNQYLPMYRCCFTVEKDYFWVDYHLGRDVEPAVLKKFEKRVRFYVDGRLSGHTKDYLYQAIEESKATNLSMPFGFPAYLSKESWVPTTWTNRINEGDRWIIIDGLYAWVYNKDGFLQKRDAKEYAPELRLQFESSKKEAAEALKQRGIQETDSEFLLDVEIQRILKYKYKIDWDTPEQLRNIE